MKIHTLALLALATLTAACSGRIAPAPEVEATPDRDDEPSPDPDPNPDPDPEPPPVDEPFFAGCAVSTLFRDPGTGLPVYRVRYTFDDEDRMLGYEYDEGPDDNVEYRQGNEYDESGRYAATLIDADGNAVIEEAYRYAYFDTGEFLRQTYELDEDQDGTLDAIFVFEADEAGNFVLSTSDLDADGVIDERTDYRYDERGNLTAVEADLDNDGVIDDRTAITYALDCQGQTPAEVFPVPERCALLQQQDLQADGTIDAVEIQRFDAEGRLVRNEVDAENDGDPILNYEAAYDDAGRLTLERLDQDDNGVLETERTFSYAEAAGGLLTTVHEERFDNESGALTSSFDYTTDESGAALGGYTASYDTDGDGELDLTELNEQDPRGVTTGLAYDLNLDGEPDYAYTVDIVDDCLDSI